MRPPRIVAAVIGVSAALALTACAATTDGQGARASATGTSSSSAAPASSAPPAPSAPSTSAASSASSASSAHAKMPTDAKALYTLMVSSVDSVATAHLAMRISASGQALTIAGDEKMSHGKVTAMNIDEQLPGGAGNVQIILADNKIYAKVPTSLNTTGKPYLLITETSRNPQVRQLAKSINSSRNTASVGGYAVFAQAADSLKLVGTEPRDGVQATHYTMVMNPSKLPPDYPSKQELIDGGVGTIPIELYIDDHGRPLEIDEHFTAKGQTIDTRATFSRYNQPVRISAPPASEVGTE